MANREKKGKLKIQKYEYLKNKKRVLHKIKSIFHKYLEAIIC